MPGCDAQGKPGLKDLELTKSLLTPMDKAQPFDFGHYTETDNILRLGLVMLAWLSSKGIFIED